MGRTKLWDAQFRFNWLASWLERLNVLAAGSGEDAATIVRSAVEREIVRREKKFNLNNK